jgi:hypothetical protein
MVEVLIPAEQSLSVEFRDPSMIKSVTLNEDYNK